MPYRYRSVAKALAAAQRMANRTGKPVKVLVTNPKRKYPRYPKKLASKYIRQEFHAGRKGKQAVAIGIARARRAKKNPVTKAAAGKRMATLGSIYARHGRARGGVAEPWKFGPAFSRASRIHMREAIKEQARRRNPEWLTGAMPRKIEGGQHMTRFFDSGRKLRAEMFEDGGAPRLLVYNPGGKIGRGLRLARPIKRARARPKRARKRSRRR